MNQEHHSVGSNDEKDEKLVEDPMMGKTIKPEVTVESDDKNDLRR